MIGNMYLRLVAVWLMVSALIALLGLAPGAASESARASFSQPLAGLNAEQEAHFLEGAAIFRQRWFAPGEGDPAFAGLGPTYIAPAYGDQLQSRAVAGVPAEGQVFVEYDAEEGHYGDGTAYRLRRPVYVFYRLSFLQLGDAAMHSPRVAPARLSAIWG